MLFTIRVDKFILVCVLLLWLNLLINQIVRTLALFKSGNLLEMIGLNLIAMLLVNLICLLERALSGIGVAKFLGLGVLK